MLDNKEFDVHTDALRTRFADAMYKEARAFYSTRRYTPAEVGTARANRTRILADFPVHEIIAVHFSAHREDIGGNDLEDILIDTLRELTLDAGRIDKDSESGELHVYCDLAFVPTLESVFDDLGIDAHKSLANPYPRGLNNWDEACKFLGVPMPKEPMRDPRE